MPNPKKYQAIVLGRKGCDITFQCANETIPTSNEINLLGVTLDSKLKFDVHVASVCRKVGGQVNALNRLQEELKAGYKINGPSPRASTRSAINFRIIDKSAPNCHRLICR